MTQAVAAPPASKAPAASSSKAPVVLKPFKVGAQDVDDECYDITLTMTNNQQNLTPQYEVPSTGFLNGVYILCEATTAANAATVVFTADGVFAAIASITFTDTNNSEIVGPINGWDLYVINKYGGYNFQDDAKSSPIFNATAGVGAGLGGSFVFALRVPVELVPRDALGSLPNKSASTPFKVKVIQAAGTDVYSTPPTTLPSIRWRMTPKSYWEPTQTDGSGNAVSRQPPGVGTTQYWTKNSPPVNPGQMNPQLTGSVGFPVRNLVWVMRDNAGSRAQGETDWPDPFKLQLQSNIIVDRVKRLWWHYIAEMYGYTNAIETAGGRDNGTFVKEFCRDFNQKPGWENRRSYLRTTDGMRMKALGTVGGAGTHTLNTYTNYIGVGAGTSLAALTT